MPSDAQILRLLRDLQDGLDHDLSLDALAARTRSSPFHFHRAFRAFTGETPKQYTLRLRLERAAGRLLTTTESIRATAAGAGFANPEVFTRAFRRRFKCSPAVYRARGTHTLPASARRRHAAVTTHVGPCVGLFHHLHSHQRRYAMPLLSIGRRVIDAQPTLSVTRSAARHELAKAIAEGVGTVYAYAQQTGSALAGHPYVRYLSVGPGLLRIEVGFHVAGPVASAADVEGGQLPAGHVVVAVHGGLYEQLPETYAAAAERWMAENNLRPAGAPWEKYVTDPAEHPDPKEWRTEIFWPTTEQG